MALETNPKAHAVMDERQRETRREPALDGCCAVPGCYRADAAGALTGQTRPVEPGAARLNLYAVSLSTLCLLHCIALPLLVTVMPVAAQAAGNELVHQVLVLVAIPVSLRVVWKALPDRLFVAAALGGLGLLLLAAFVEAVSLYEQPVTVTGAALLGSAHVWHWVRRCGRSGSRDLPLEID